MGVWSQIVDFQTHPSKESGSARFVVTVKTTSAGCCRQFPDKDCVLFEIDEVKGEKYKHVLEIPVPVEQVSVFIQQLSQALALGRE